MKRISKSLAMFLTVVLALGMLSLPTLGASVAQTSYDMEQWDVDGEGNALNPKGFTISSDDPENVIISCDTSDVAGNTSKKLKIEHKTNTTTRVKVHVLDEDVKDVGVGVYWSFILGSDFTGTGLKLSSDRIGQKTNYFTNNTYTWWRKMMVFSDKDGWAHQSDYVAEFTGTGTVYLDDVSWELSILANGDFEGLCGDGQLTGTARTVDGVALATGTFRDYVNWSYTAADITSIIRTDEEADPETLEPGAYFVETPEGNYIEIINKTRSNKLKYATREAVALATGKSYVIRASHMSNNKKNGLGISFDGGFSLPIQQQWTNATDTMTEKAFYVLFNSFGMSARPIFYFLPHNAKKSTVSTEVPYVRIDDVRLEEVQESCTLTDTVGIPVAFENGKTVNISYQKPLYDGAKDTSGGATSVEKVTVFAALYDVTEATPKLMEIDVCGELRAKGSFDATVPVTSGASVGYLPATYTMEEGFEIPETGKYMIKVFTMDSVSGLSPKGENVYTFMTEAE